MKAQVLVGDKFIGKYMGCQFSGVVSSVESSQSGYSVDGSHCRVYIKTDAPVFYRDGAVRVPAGEALIMDCLKTPQGLVRQDERYSNLFLKKRK